jgi:hypothetical protein
MGLPRSALTLPAASLIDLVANGNDFLESIR